MTPRPDDAGSAVVEFAILAPLLIVLLIGVMAIGAVIWVQVGLGHATAAAARCGSVNAVLCPTTQATQAYAVGQSYGVDPPSSSFAVSTASCGTLVSVNYTYRLLSGAWSLPAITVQSSSCFPK